MAGKIASPPDHHTRHGRPDAWPADSHYETLAFRSPARHAVFMERDRIDNQPRGRPRSEKAHAAILDAAIALTREVGFDALAMEAVAARAGVGKATVYRRWKTKEALLAEAVHRLVQGAPGLLRAVHPADDRRRDGLRSHRLPFHPLLRRSLLRHSSSAASGTTNRDPAWESSFGAPTVAVVM